MALKSLRVAFTVVAWLGAAAPVALAQQQPAAPLTVKQLKSDVYWTQGGPGSNTGIIIGSAGVIVVDTGTTADGAKQRLAEIAKLTLKPVTHVILTHSDGDHVNGLAGFPAGLTIIAHENDKKEMEAALAAGGRGAPPAGRLPTRVVTQNKEELSVEGVKLQLLHWAPAHTSGDLIAYLPDKKIAFVGDIIDWQIRSTGRAADRANPGIHLAKNGSSEGWLTTVRGIVALDADQFVPGHGDLQTKADLQAALAATAQKRDRIAALVKEGRSLDEVRTALGEAPPQTGGRGPAFESFTDVVYQELTKRR